MQLCECSVCRMKTLSIPETRHRRCGGGFKTEEKDDKQIVVPNPMRAKHQKLPIESRGVWRSA